MPQTPDADGSFAAFNQKQKSIHDAELNSHHRNSCRKFKVILFIVFVVFIHLFFSLFHTFWKFVFVSLKAFQNKFMSKRKELTGFNCRIELQSLEIS